MTPEKKAMLLIGQFGPYAFAHTDNEFNSMIDSQHINAKQCALICVVELIELSNQWEEAAMNYYPAIQIEDTEYWQQVKEEIEKL